MNSNKPQEHSRFTRPRSNKKPRPRQEPKPNFNKTPNKFKDLPVKAEDKDNLENLFQTEEIY